MSHEAKPMTDRQVGLICSVIFELTWLDALKVAEADDLIARTHHLHETRGATVEQASIFIDKLLAAKAAARDARRPVPTAPPAAPVITATEGMYRNPTSKEIYKVQKSLSSGRLYAKRLVLRSGGEVHFEFDRGAVYMLKPEWKMTLADAKEFGALYGTCCVCGRTLTNEGSIEAGIGPICARSFS